MADLPETELDRVETAERPLTRASSLPHPVLAQLADSATQAFVIHRGGPALFLSTAAREILGIGSDSPEIARPVLEWIHPEDRSMVTAYTQARLNGRHAPKDYEFRIIRPDGAEVSVNCRASLIDWADGPAIVASLFDVTSQKRSEHAQLRSEALFKRVFQATPAMVALSYLDTGIFLDVNDNLAGAIGMSREEILGENIFDLGIWEDPYMPLRIRSAIRRYGAINQLEGRLRRADGSYFPVSLCGETLEVDGAEVLLIIGRDISEEKRREAELRESRDEAELANRAKSEFLANISHELRTPLNAIIGFSEIIRDAMFGPLPDSRYQDYAGDIHRSGTHLLEIINDILDLSKVEAGRLDPQPSRIEVGEIVWASVRLLRDRARRAELELDAAVTPEQFEITADPRLLKQILLNLLSNAIKFTPPGGRIALRAERGEAGGLILRVSDTGAGMGEDEIAKALTPFGQTGRAMTREREGTGLGLPLVAAFVEVHGGSYRIDSTPGAGTTFTAEIPPAPP